jgi:hypothetical protein
MPAAAPSMTPEARERAIRQIARIKGLLEQ